MSKIDDGRILIQNTAGRFSQYMAQGCFSRIGRELFCQNESTKLEIPDLNINLEGINSITEWFDSKEGLSLYDKSSHRMHLLHSHLNKPNDDGSIRAMWVTSSYDFFGNGKDYSRGEFSFQYYFTRIDADMVEENGEWKFKNVMWYGLESLIPETYNPYLEPGMFTNNDIQDLTIEPQYNTTANDYVAIRNLQSRFTLNNRKDLIKDYASLEDISLDLPHLLPNKKVGRAEVIAAIEKLEQTEKDNDDLYLSVPALYSPIIEVGKDGVTAEGTWLSMVFDVFGPARGCYGSTCPVAHRIAWLKGTYVKEDGIWKYKSIEMKTLFTLPFRSLRTDSSRGLINRGKGARWNEWPVGYNTCPDAKDYFEIEEVLSSWVTYIQNGDASEWFSNYLDIDNPELKQVFPTRKPPYNEYLIERGTDGFANFAHLMDTGAKSQLKRHGIHAVSTPMVEISPDGKYATARSTEIGFTMMAGLTGVVFEPPYEAQPAVAVYEHSFRKDENGKWKLFEFKWLALYQYSGFWFDPKTTRGWTGTLSKRRWPKPYAKYIYSNDENDKVNELDDDLGNSRFFRECKLREKNKF